MLFISSTAQHIANRSVIEAQMALKVHPKFRNTFALTIVLCIHVDYFGVSCQI